MSRLRVAVCVALSVMLFAGCSDTGTSDQSSAAGPDGEKIFNQFCFSCHAAGIGGAPLPGDTENWKPRLAKGEALLLAVTKAGIDPGMPPMGMCLQCSDAELSAAIVYMSTPQ